MVFYRTRRGVDGDSFTAKQRVLVSGDDVDNYATVKGWDSRARMYEVAVDGDVGRTVMIKATGLCSVLNAWERFANAGGLYGVAFKTLQKDWKGCATAQGVANILAEYKQRKASTIASTKGFAGFAALPKGWTPSVYPAKSGKNVTVYVKDGIVVCPAFGHLRTAVPIMADAAHVILTSPSRATTGHFYIDEEVLRGAGVTDFSIYSPSAKGPLAADFFVPDEVFDRTQTRLARNY